METLTDHTSKCTYQQLSILTIKRKDEIKMKPKEWCYLGMPYFIGEDLEGVGATYLNEIFVPVIFYDMSILENYYISNYGKLYSRRYKRLISQYLDEGGYYRVNITYAPGKTIFTGVHKLELMTFNPIMPKDLEIYIPNHKDGNKINNFIGNLEWMTISENTRHALDTGLANYKCENSPRSYITNEKVHEICKYLEQNKPVPYILDEFGYPYGDERNRMAAIIRLIRKGQTYMDISQNYNIPGIKGKRRYEPEMTEKVCQLLSDGNHYSIDKFCDLLGIDLNDRKMFRNYVDDILANKTHSYITKKYTDMKRPDNLLSTDPMYKYYN